MERNGYDNETNESLRSFNNKFYGKRRRNFRRKRTSRPFIVEVVLTEDASTLQLPEYKTNGSAGADLKALNDGTINPGEILKLVRTGIKIKIPRGFEGQIRPRSGLSTKGLTIINTPGTIDSDYRGEVMINFFNEGKEPISWKAGDRIAQIVFAPVKRAIFNNKPEFSPDYNNDRNENGFGSTGSNNCNE